MASYRGFSFRLFTKTGKVTKSFQAAFAFEIKFKGKVIVKPRRFHKREKTARLRQTAIEDILVFLISKIESRPTVSGYSKYKRDVRYSKIDFSNPNYISYDKLLSEFNKSRIKKGKKVVKKKNFFSKIQLDVLTESPLYSKEVVYKVIKSTKLKAYAEELEANINLNKPIKVRWNKSFKKARNVLHKLINPHVTKFLRFTGRTNKKNVQLLFRVYFDVYNIEGEIVRSQFYSSHRQGLSESNSLKLFTNWFADSLLGPDKDAAMREYLTQYDGYYAIIKAIGVQAVFATDKIRTEELDINDLKRMEKLSYPIRKKSK